MDDLKGSVAIGIPTYRRPEKLKRLLASLHPSLKATDAAIAIADNACDPATRLVAEQFAEIWPNTHYIAVPERGISANRNKLIDWFLTRPDAPVWLATADDDLVMSPDWMKQMVATGEACKADIVGGPYGMIEPAGSFIVRESMFVKRRRRKTGLTSPIYAAGNLLINRKLLTQYNDLRFNNRFGLSGGEDYDFFSRADGLGARFAWCDDAFCNEDVDIDRLNARAVIYRYYTTGNYMALIDLQRESRGVAWQRHLWGFVKSGAYLVVSGARLRPEDALEGLFRLLISAGALSALLGVRHYRYR
ncbi:glycosyltransferase family 2 protein [Sphingomonas sp. Leaf343]|uniref:glycosyltransferase family 2 protein n=1 Tax=Sphingomonas sp. Leaf343 TaxID=1736345 RepID=UPI000ACDCAD4|nr:glycosyltransferase [Sphingomonas sp. Leaf343]